MSAAVQRGRRCASASLSTSTPCSARSSRARASSPGARFRRHRLPSTRRAYPRTSSASRPRGEREFAAQPGSPRKCMSASRSRTRAAGWRLSGCRTCSASTARRDRTRRRGHSLGARHLEGARRGARRPLIRAESAGAGRGATFTFTLPVAGEGRRAGRSSPPTSFNHRGVGYRMAKPPLHLHAAGGRGRGVRRGGAARPGGRESPRTRPRAGGGTTTRRRCATSAAAAPAPATPCWSPATPRTCPASSPPRGPPRPPRPSAAGRRRHRAARPGAGAPRRPVVFISAYGRDQTVAQALKAWARRLHRQSRSHRPSSPPASAPRCAAPPVPDPSCWATSPSTTTRAASLAAGTRVPTPFVLWCTLRASHLELGGVDLDLAVEDDVLPLDRADMPQQIGVEREIRRGGQP